MEISLDELEEALSKISNCENEEFKVGNSVLIKCSNAPGLITEIRREYGKVHRVRVRFEDPQGWSRELFFFPDELVTKYK